MTQLAYEKFYLPDQIRIVSGESDLGGRDRAASANRLDAYSSTVSSRQCGTEQLF